MSLARKTLVLFLLLGCAISAGSYIALRVSVLPAFTAFEHQVSVEATSRVESLMSGDLHALEVINLEYSAWDETIRYIETRDPTFQQDNLSPGYWHSIDMSMVMVFDKPGQLVYGWIVDPSDGRPLPLDEELLDPMPPDHVLVDHESEDSSTTGLLRTRTGLMYVSSYPVLSTEGVGPVSGTVVVGQFLDDDMLADIGDRATADVSLHIMGQKALPTHVVSAFKDLPDRDTAVVTYTDSVHGLKILSDVYGEPAAVLEIRQPRTITGIGSDTIRTTMLFLAGGSVSFLLAALFFIQRLIVSPIETLTAKLLKMQHTGDLEFELEETRTDEVGVLAAQFADLTSGLRKARRELETARDEALSMSQAKSEFLARMSHEIRTPMNGVLGMTELLQNTPLDDKQERFARTIYSSAESLLHIINDILDISKIEAGKLELDIAPFNLRNMVEECLELLADTAHRKNLELIGVIPTDAHPFVEGDALRLRQVLVNLISNAVKFTEQGEIVVRIEEQDSASDKIRYRFEVVDTGIGISAKNLEKVFDPFTQEDGSTTRRYGGTGLGLSICKQLLDLMGGEIGVDSNPEGGCTFWFTVELVRDATSAELLNPELLEGKRVLIVDDNATNRETLRHQLESWNMRVEPASSGPEALGLLSGTARNEQPFNIILLDMNMPEMDGVELAISIRQTEGGNIMPLVMLSSVSAADAGEGRSIASIDAWLTKPVRQARLHDALVSHLSRRRDVIVSDDITDVQSLATNDNAYRNLRILMAEDNEVNQAVALGMLDKLGHETTVVANGQQAIDVFKSQDFDLVLMDCQMPVLGGFKATRAIRDWEREQDRAATRIIALTANALSGDRERCIAAGMNEYVSKPFSLGELGAAIATNMQEEQAADSRASDSGSTKPHVLVVDDNIINQQVTRAMVEELGFDADIVADGAQALRAAAARRYDLVLMDCHMPVMNGYDTTREMRRLEEESADDTRTPIIAVTADLMQSNRQRCLNCGMDDYVTKPFTEEQLRLVMGRWLNDPDSGDVAAEVIVDADGFSELTETTALASIDRMALEEIYQLDSSPAKNTVREIVVSYCAVSTKLILQLRVAVADRDTEQIELLAHSLKGSSGQVGAVLLAALCEQILSDVRTNELGNAESLCERAAIEHSAVIIALDKEMQRIAA